MATSEANLSALPSCSADSDDSDTACDSNEDVSSKNHRLGEHFAIQMKDLAQVRGYRKVAVLLLSWIQELEDYLDTTDEVDALHAVFKDDYRFTIHEHKLHAKRGQKASQQMNRHLTDFIMLEDGKDTLLIVYYAGHGIKDVKSEDLHLIGGNPGRGNRKASFIVWTEAERQLQNIDADLLLIFDCCHAGILASKTKSRSPTDKIFEFLGATQHNRTAVGPGPDSFTTALTYALKKLAGQSDGFTTSSLYREIQDAPRFKDIDQAPVWSERGEPSLHRLKIQAMPMEEDEEKLENAPDPQTLESSVECYLNLQILWTKRPAKKHVELLCDSLKDLVKKRDLPVKQYLWRGLSNEDNTITFRDAAYKWMAKAKLRRGSSIPTIKDLKVDTNSQISFETTGSPEELRNGHGRDSSESSEGEMFRNKRSDKGQPQQTVDKNIPRIDYVNVLVSDFVPVRSLFMVFLLGFGLAKSTSILSSRLKQ